MKCKACGGENASKVLFLGFPGWLCEDCYTCGGLASWAAWLWARLVPRMSDEDTGFMFMAYTGSYWRALWTWLRGKVK